MTIMKLIKDSLKDLYYYKYKKMSISDVRIMNLRKVGMTIGENCGIFSEHLETVEPYLVSIGNHVTIAPNVWFTTHDASANIFFDDVSDWYGRITIGNDVFIGMSCTFLPGTSIADRCIVGAGSVVTKRFTEPGKVIAGNPARVICDIETWKQKHEHQKLMAWGKTFDEKRAYLLKHEDLFE